MKISLFSVLLLLALISLSTQKLRGNTVPDVSTLSNVLDFETVHFHLKLNVDFDLQQFQGSQTLSLLSLKNGVKRVDLDVNSLQIDSVFDENNNKLEFTVFYPNPNIFGEQLRINLNKGSSKGQVFNITINYVTEGSYAISWLTPVQTATKTLPYLYSQCESVICRNIAPFQDTPYIKSTYTAIITARNDVEVFLSANKTASYIHPTTTSLKVHEFRSDIPIPSYLFAIIAGNVEERQMGRRTFLITEPSNMDAFAEELSELELFLDTVESIATPYIWGIYKIVIQPPSFPIGGMENPLLTFASPSIIAGDKSGISVAVHEIAHSWSGNMVTCENWSNLWLNEGITMYLERAADAIMFGPDYSIVDAIVGNDTMVDSIEYYGFDSNYTALYPITKGASPDDSFSLVPYEKGYQFLKYIETLTGAELLQSFLRAYFNKFALQSIQYEQLQQFFNEYILREVPDQAYNIISQINWEKWVRSPGMPIVNLEFSTPIIPSIRKLAQDYLDLEGQGSPSNWEVFLDYTLNERSIFLQYLYDHSDQFTLEVAVLIDQNYDLTNSTNKEINWRWLRLVIPVFYGKAEETLDSYLGSIGRIKLISPVYQALNSSGQRDLAIFFLDKYSSFYHPLAVISIKRVLGLN